MQGTWAVHTWAVRGRYRRREGVKGSHQAVCARGCCSGEQFGWWKPPSGVRVCGRLTSSRYKMSSFRVRCPYFVHRTCKLLFLIRWFI